jgi:hypothetical protein
MKTSQLSIAVQISVNRIRHLLASGRIPRPPKDWSGDYVWGQQDIDRLLEVAGRDGRRKAVGEAADAVRA